MSIIVVVATAGALPDHVSTMVIGVLSKVKVLHLSLPKIQKQVGLGVASSPRSPQELQNLEL